MIFFSLLVVLLLEHIGPLPYRTLIREPALLYARLIEARLNAGEGRHGVAAWLLAVGAPMLLAGIVYAACYAFSPLLAVLWNIVILYLTMGFRQSGLVYSDIEFALRMDDLPRARQLLREWREQGLRPEVPLTSRQLARQAIEEVLMQSHRHVFGMLFFFVLLPGPCGAVLYRTSALLAEAWRGGGEGPDAVELELFGRFSRRAFALLDAVAARVTAGGFAIAGNFESAVYAWRTQAATWVAQGYGQGLGVVLASGAGAIGVALHDSAGQAGSESAGGREADPDAMQSAYGLLLRTLFLWMVLLLLLGLASLFGA